MYSPNISAGHQNPSQTATSGALPQTQFTYPQPPLLQSGPASQFPPPALPALPGQSGAMQTYQPMFDTSGQIAPPGMKPRVTATLWEDEGSLCFQVEARGICIARREDNHMINGTKLLNVAGMTRGRRDGILKSEKVRHVVKIGPMHLKGVWIPYERALDFANKEKITELLYPLFVHNIGSMLYNPSNQPRVSQVMQAAERRKQEQNQLRGHIPAPSGLPSIHQHPGTMTLAGPQQPLPSHASLGQAPLDTSRHIYGAPSAQHSPSLDPSRHMYGTQTTHTSSYQAAAQHTSYSQTPSSQQSAYQTTAAHHAPYHTTSAHPSTYHPAATQGSAYQTPTAAASTYQTTTAQPSAYQTTSAAAYQPAPTQHSTYQTTAAQAAPYQTATTQVSAYATATTQAASYPSVTAQHTGYQTPSTLPSPYQTPNQSQDRTLYLPSTTTTSYMRNDQMPSASRPAVGKSGYATTTGDEEAEPEPEPEHEAEYTHDSGYETWQSGRDTPRTAAPQSYYAQQSYSTAAVATPTTGTKRSRDEDDDASQQSSVSINGGGMDLKRRKTMMDNDVARTK